MADELKTDGQTITDPKGDETQVTISQEKLDSLINEKFKKGAEKANAKLLEELGVDSIDSVKDILKAKQDADEAAKSELEKAKELAETLQTEKEELLGKYEKTEKENQLTKLATKYGVEEVDYFELELSRVEKGEDFNMDNFINSLKESKPSLFGKVKPPKTDTSGNGGNPPEFKDKLKGLSLQELIKLQQSL